ncbi:hypothetical protein CSPX01_13170 [Colletotrichum filicis]|nr:hypothetical protein CSPX01_13170 [Colletotrichum filicis]
MTGNGLPMLLHPPNKPHTEPSEITDGGDQMYTEAMRQGRAPISPTRKQFFPVISFADRLYMAFATNPQTRRQFLPKSQLHSLIEKTSVIEELENRMPMLSKSTRERYASLICCESPLKIYQKIFTILVLIDMVPTIEDFFNEEIYDAHLPLVKDSETGGLFNLRTKEDLSRQLKPFATWNMIQKRNFESYQWIILPPFFTKGKRKNVKHYVLEPDRVLPFTSATDGGKSGMAEIHRGGFSRVLQAEIHPDHHDFSDPTIVEPNVSPFISYFNGIADGLVRLHQPPECDLDQRFIRQSYDIWSLGCVFLEFITWSIGGKRLLLEFARKRTSPDRFLAGFDSDTFFEIKDPKGKDSAAAYVKPAVVQVCLSPRPSLDLSQFYR